MFLADTSVWIDYFRKANTAFSSKVKDGFIFTHEFIILELAAGSIPKRSQTLKDIDILEKSNVLDSKTILEFIEIHNLYSKGLSMVDIHLIASALDSNLELITLDKKLKYYWNKIKK